MRNRVFLVQRPAYRKEGRWVDKYDLSAAYRYGQVVELLPPGNIRPGDEARIAAALADFRPERDFVLLLGDPVAAALAVGALVQAGHGRLNLLKWAQSRGEYDPFPVDLSADGAPKVRKEP